MRLSVSEEPPLSPFFPWGVCMSSEGLDEIRRAINDVRYADRKRRFRRNWDRIFSRDRNAGSAAPKSSTDCQSSEQIKVQGYVPRSFLTWISKQKGRDRNEHDMLSRCYFKEVKR